MMKTFMVTCEKYCVGATTEVRAIVEARSASSAINKFKRSNRFGKKIKCSSPRACEIH